MKNIIYLLLLAILFTSCDCENKEFNNEENSTSVKNENNGSKKRTLFEEMGIEFSDEKLIIDINKTTNFFGALEKKIEQSAKKIEQKVERKIDEIDINITRDTGIEIGQEEINIDLNKTKNMLDNISHIFENLLFESNSTKF